MNISEVKYALHTTPTKKQAAKQLKCGYSTLRKFCVKHGLKSKSDTTVKYTKSRIAAAVETSKTFVEVCAKLSIPKHGGSFQRLKEKIIEYNIPVSHITTKSAIAKLQEWNKTHKGVRTVKQGVRESRKKLVTLMTGVTEKCFVCGLTVWINKPIKLHIDHIDGNHKNNIKSNLQYLCPNCHTQKTYPVLA